MIGAPPRCPSAPCPARNLCTQLPGAHTPAQSCPAALAQEMQNVTPPTTVWVGVVVEGGAQCHSEVSASSSTFRLDGRA